MNKSKYKKILLITFSGNADHQDITFGMFEELYSKNSVWLMCTKNPKVALNAANNIRYVDCPERPGVNKKTFKLSTLYKEIRWIKKQKFDVIFFETLHTWNIPIMVATRGKTKIYQMIHDVVPHKGDKSEKAVKLMNSVVCKLADIIVLVNRKYINTLIEMYKIPKVKVKYIDMWRRFPAYVEPLHTKKVLFFGRLNPYKGIDNLLKIVEMCPEIKFNVVGRVDSQVEEIVKELKKKQNVTLKVGYVSDKEMKDAFLNSDCVILPYNSATQSGVVIDAYKYGKPVIAYDVGALSEQVEEGNGGFLVPQDDLQNFINKLKMVMELDKKRYDELSRKAYEYGKRKYDVEGATIRFLDLISIDEIEMHSV